MSENLLKTNAILPTYDRTLVVPRIVHLGFGAFHRAHQAIFADDLASQHGSDWGYIEVNLLGGEDLIAGLKKQELLFSVSEMSNEGWQSRVVGVVCQALHANQDGIESILLALTHPEVAIVSITVTEKGYCHIPATGKLDLTNSSITHDLADPTHPHSVPGVIVAGMARRRAAGLPGVSIMSCDNMPENGRVTRQVVLTLARQQDLALAEWIEVNCSFPSTMVDRIVPAVTAATLDQIESHLGTPDPVGVACEPFRQWVIEDNFVAGRPQWEKVGGELVSDVLPYEEMKLRMLNGSHSFLAYLGYLAGYEYINDCMKDVDFCHAARQLMLSEQAPTLALSEIDLTKYAESLLQRYANPALRHRTWQIAMDGSQKLPQRLLDPIRSNLLAGRSFELQALAVAAWMRYVGGVDEASRLIDVRDPLLALLQTKVKNSQEGTERVKALLSVDTIFGVDLPVCELFVTAIERAYLHLLHHGAVETVRVYSQCIR
ncbi:MAG: mannitol dehydrogenase family protein [Aeromonas allosaccharophila]